MHGSVKKILKKCYFSKERFGEEFSDNCDIPQARNIPNELISKIDIEKEH